MKESRAYKNRTLILQTAVSKGVGTGRAFSRYRRPGRKGWFSPVFLFRHVGTPTPARRGKTTRSYRSDSYKLRQGDRAYYCLYALQCPPPPYTRNTYTLFRYVYS